MKRKEQIIRYLGRIERASRQDVAMEIKASPHLTSVYLGELKRAGIVQNVEWPDGSKVWFLTKEGDRRWHYYVKRNRDRGA